MMLSHMHLILQRAKKEPAIFPPIKTLKKQSDPFSLFAKFNAKPCKFVFTIMLNFVELLLVINNCQ